MTSGGGDAKKLKNMFQKVKAEIEQERKERLRPTNKADKPGESAGADKKDERDS